jgi:hypothetical protein
MSQIGVAKFIAAVALHFPRPKFNEDEGMEGAWMASMNRVLSHYPDEILADAAMRILAKRNPKRDGRFFPTPSECVEFCDESVDVRRLRETPLLEAPKEMPYDARCNLARDLMQSPMGVLARKEGWSESMFYFIVDHARVPGGTEIDHCKREAVEFAKLRKEGLKDHPFGVPLSKLADAMVRKARELMGEKVA